jgi:cyclic beta-1,2-glucan synthetase
MYRAGIEGLLGLTRAGSDLTLDPCFPTNWPELAANLGHGKTRCDITILNPNNTGHGIASATLNGTSLPVVAGKVTLSRSAAKGQLTLVLQ